MVDQKDAQKLAQLNLRLSEYTSRYWAFFEEDEERFEGSPAKAVLELQECSRALRSLLADMPTELKNDLSGILGNGWQIKLSMMLKESYLPFDEAILLSRMDAGNTVHQEVDFSQVKPAKNWEEVEEFMKSIQEAVFAAYLLFRRGEFDFFEDATSGKLPSLNTDNGQWIAATDLTVVLKVKVDTLQSYRTKSPIASTEEGKAGIDTHGRSWRKSADNKIWYYIPHLSEEAKVKCGMQNQ